MRTTPSIVAEMAQDDAGKLERLTDLILYLLTVTQPVPLTQIVAEVPGYPEGHEAYRQAFERDKVLLRDEGILVETIAIDGNEQFGYRILPSTFFLPDLGLAPDEEAALNLAVAGVHLGTESGGDALKKLGVVELDEIPAVAALESTSGLDRLFQAIASKAEVRFDYFGEARTVIPLRLRFAQGHWYLAGFSKERQAGRNFRVDRINGAVRLGPPGSGSDQELESIPLELPDEPWSQGEPGEGATTIRVLVDPLYAWRVASEVGDDRVVERRGDGSVVVEVAVTSNEVARSWVLSFLEHAEVLAPESFRHEVITWLEGIAHERPVPLDAPGLEDLDEEGADGQGAARVPRTQRRLRRLLAMLEWLASEGTVRTSEVAERFDMTEEDVIAELELAACCGRPPYSPGELMDIIVDADHVVARLPDLQRPRQLSAAEGVAVAAAARTILAIPGADGEGALHRALVKLEAALGDRAAIQVDLPAPPLLGELSAATDERREISVEYLAASTDELTQRVIDPLRVVALDGRWYVEAYCHRAGERRTFRADLFKSIVDVGPQPDDLDRSIGGDEPFTPAPDATIAILQVTPAARWMADSIPLRARRFEEDGSAFVAVSVSGGRWFERLLLQAGLGATVCSPPALASVARDAAERVLERYHATV